jgi:hypothetical protein
VETGEIMEELSHFRCETCKNADYEEGSYLCCKKSPELLLSKNTRKIISIVGCNSHSLNALDILEAYTNDRYSSHHTCYQEYRRLIKLIRNDPELARIEGIDERWLKE